MVWFNLSSFGVFFLFGRWRGRRRPKGRSSFGSRRLLGRMLCAFDPSSSPRRPPRWSSRPSRASSRPSTPILERFAILSSPSIVYVVFCEQRSSFGYSFLMIVVVECRRSASATGVLTWIGRSQLWWACRRPSWRMSYLSTRMTPIGHCRILQHLKRNLMTSSLPPGIVYLFWTYYWDELGVKIWCKRNEMSICWHHVSLSVVMDGHSFFR